MYRILFVILCYVFFVFIYFAWKVKMIKSPKEPTIPTLSKQLDKLGWYEIESNRYLKTYSNGYKTIRINLTMELTKLRFVGLLSLAKRLNEEKECLKRKTNQYSYTGHLRRDTIGTNRIWQDLEPIMWVLIMLAIGIHFMSTLSPT